MLLLAGCTTLPKVVRQDGIAALAQGTRAGPLVVRPDQVDEDSRCPLGVQCITAGRVLIEVSYWRGHEPGAVRMELGVPVSIDGGTLLLDRVEPVRKPKGRIRPEDYRFHFTWQGA